MLENLLMIKLLEGTPISEEWMARGHALAIQEIEEKTRALEEANRIIAQNRQETEQAALKAEQARAEKARLEAEQASAEKARLEAELARQKAAQEAELARQKAAQEAAQARQQALQAMQQTIVSIVATRFPELELLAKFAVATISDLQQLQSLILELSLAPDQAHAQQIFASLASPASPTDS